MKGLDIIIVNINNTQFIVNLMSLSCSAIQYHRWDALEEVKEQSPWQIQSKMER